MLSDIPFNVLMLPSYELRKPSSLQRYSVGIFSELFNIDLSDVVTPDAGAVDAHFDDRRMSTNVSLNGLRFCAGVFTLVINRGPSEEAE